VLVILHFNFLLCFQSAQPQIGPVANLISAPSSNFTLIRFTKIAALKESHFCEMWDSHDGGYGEGCPAYPHSYFPFPLAPLRLCFVHPTSVSTTVFSRVAYRSDVRDSKIHRNVGNYPPDYTVIHFQTTAIFKITSPKNCLSLSKMFKKWR
jgi:hypothetical protein